MRRQACSLEGFEIIIVNLLIPRGAWSQGWAPRTENRAKAGGKGWRGGVETGERMQLG